ncbi:hypothetical protein B0H13DRAFT_1872529 [Mycena leptocephala]|nr:hypothetical protein B0H13DRAFT_1872529 [Mycena leptocephala]
MTSFPYAAPGTGTPSVSSAASPASSGGNTAAMQLLSAALFQMSQASNPVQGGVIAPIAAPASAVPTPAPATSVPAPAPTTAVSVPVPPTVFHATGPWVAGALYIVVPGAPLAAIPEATPAYGHFVGCTLSNALALNATIGVSGSAMKSYKTQALALTAFNQLLGYQMITHADSYLIRALYSPLKIVASILWSPHLQCSRFRIFQAPTPPVIFLFHHRPFSPRRSMSADNDSFDYDDPAFLSLLASLDLADHEPSPPPPPPRTPSPRPLAVQRHTFPAMNGRNRAASRPTIYQYESPTRQGYTTEWFAALSHFFPVLILFTRSVAGTATQGVPGGHVRVVGSRPPAKNKPKREAEPLPVVVADGANPLNGTEDFDGKWFVGITPGVYRSHLECQLNTVGVRGALHQSVEGISAALEKFAAATSRDEATIAQAPPFWYTGDSTAAAISI